MECKVEKTQNANEVKLEIKIEAEKFNAAIKKVYFQSAKYFNIPGFRKGKAPKDIVEKYYGKEIFYEDAFNDLVPELYEQAFTHTSYSNFSNFHRQLYKFIDPYNDRIILNKKIYGSYVLYGTKF